MALNALSLDETDGRAVSSPTRDEKRAARKEKRDRERLLRGWAAPARPLLIAAMLAGLGGALGKIFQSFALAAALYTGVIQRSAPTTVALWLAALGMATLLKAGCAYLESWYGARAALRIQQGLRQRLLAALLAPDRLVAEASAPQAAAHAQTFIEQVDRLEKYYARYLPQLWLAVLSPLLFLLAIFPANWVVGIILLAVTPIIPLYMALIGSNAAERSGKQVAAVQYLSTYFLDRLRGLATLRRLGAHEREVTQIEAASEQLGKRSMDVLNVALLSSAVLEFFSTLAIAITAIYIGFTLLGFFHFGIPQAGMTLQTGLFLLLLAAVYFQPLRAFAAAYHDRADALAAVERLAPLLSAAADAHLPEQPASVASIRLASTSAATTDLHDALRSAPAITLQQVSLCYTGQSLPALSNVSFEIPAGEMVALVGPSGAGKSSLLALLAGLAEPTGGQINVGDMRVTSQDLPILRASVSWIGQRPYLFPGTLAENIAFGQQDIPRQRIEAAARQARMLDFANARSAGLDTQIGERGSGLSGGEAQRVALARAFLRDTPLLLLDEPTTSLDPTTEREVIETILTLAQSRTIVVATHSPALIAQCSQVVQLEHGQVVSASTDREIDTPSVAAASKGDFSTAATGEARHA